MILLLYLCTIVIHWHYENKDIYIYKEENIYYEISLKITSSFYWCYTTSKFGKYIKSIKKIIQVWWPCIWKVISLSVLCIIYKPVIITCVVKKMVCFVKSLCFCFVVQVFSCQCTGIGVILRETPLKKTNFFAWKYVWNELKKRNFHTIIKLCY